MKPRILVVGSANTDMIARVPKIPLAGETVLGGQFAKAGGGKGANQAVAAARLGAEVTFVARVGADALGEEAIAAYRAERIHVDYIVQDAEAPTGVALIMVDLHGENVIAVTPGANSKLSPADIQAAESAFQTADCLLLQLEIPFDTVQAAAEMARRYRVKVILNPAPAQVLPTALLAHVDLLTPNQHEVSVVTGSVGLPGEHLDSQFLGDWLAKAGIQGLIVTQGAHGATFIDPSGGQLTVPGFRVEAVDATAAGDSFNAALAVAIAQGKEMVEAIRFANAVGALTATRVGAQTSLPDLTTVQQFLNER